MPVVEEEMGNAYSDGERCEVFSEAISPVAQNAHETSGWPLQSESREHLYIGQQICERLAEVPSVNLDTSKSVAAT